MFCGQCGSSIAADARLCSSCGTALSGEPPSNAIAKSVTEPGRRRSAARTSLFGGFGLLAAIIVIAIIAANMRGNNSGSRAAVPASEAPTRVVASFYGAISRKDFRTAWNLLSPAFQKDDESFEKFREGYATTQAVSVSVAEVPGAPQKVRTSLDATDLMNGNTVHSKFEGWWVLTRASNGRWLLDNGHFTKTATDTPGLTAAVVATPMEMPTDTSTRTDTTTPTATSVPILICCTANVDGMHYTVTGVQRTDMIAGDFNKVYNAQGQFIIVKLHVANETNRPATVNEPDFGLINSAGVKFAPNIDVTGLSTAFVNATINPGNSLSGVLVYDVTAGTDSTKYGIQCFTNGATGDATNWEAIRLPRSIDTGVGVLAQ